MFKKYFFFFFLWENFHFLHLFIKSKPDSILVKIIFKISYGEIVTKIRD